MNQFRPWILAARPPTLWAAVAPVLIGSALAHRDGVFRWDAFVVTGLAAVLIQIGVNYANDYSDGVRGTDSPDRIGPQRAVASKLVTPQQMRAGIGIVFGLAALLGLYLATIAGPVIIVIGAVSIVAALGYTGGPIPYGYRGLGEVFVFVFFGLVATVGTRFVFDRTAPLDAWVGGVAMGLLATAILIANNIRDLDTDAAAGKRTLAVKLGRDRTRTLFAAVVYGAFGVVALSAALQWTPPWTTLALAALPLGIRLATAIRRAVAGPELIAALKGTARLQLLVGVLFAAGALV
ncbi:MAG TPA: 1,4-dihydroxy-2-naphthoate polyprenyltransferase [Acidimicrobiia bacterium]|jgi:1,4-dihydroxy-2-naphthoate octaprenyltransferase|nr:1,4-dihydroxy-2-naphthoate polyprenyltransferase [Acidimicrobiia bacterium]